MSKELVENENLKYQLETLAQYEPDDLDSPEFDVAYESESGVEGMATVCCIDLAARSLSRIKELEAALSQQDAPPSTAQEDKHEWDGSLERCLKCGDKDWFAGPKCEGRIKPSQPTAQEDSPTKGMSLGERIAHVGGRENEAGYTEFGSVMAVKALIDHVLRDIDRPSQPAAQGVEPVVHIFPHDLEKAETTECKVGVYSVPQGSPDHGKTIPLYKHSEPLRNKAPSCSDNWGIQVVGPDDVYATKSFDEAIKKCAEFNAGILVISEDISQRKNASLYPVVWAKVDRWDAISSAPHCPEITNWDSFLSSPPLEDGMVRVSVEPSRGLLVSMAMRNDHGFGLLSSGQQEPILRGMRQIHEEVVGTGFYKPERESEYLETLKAASKGE